MWDDGFKFSWIAPALLILAIIFASIGHFLPENHLLNQPVKCLWQECK